VGRWLVIGGIFVVMLVAALLYGRVTKHGPDKAWSDRQDDGRRQALKTRAGAWWRWP
jgi:hypothetical protein